MPDAKKLLRCACGSPFDFTAIRKCGGCQKVICWNCSKLFRDLYFCKPCRKERADAASRGIELE
jgi:hypothetical protein